MVDILSNLFVINQISSKNYETVNACIIFPFKNYKTLNILEVSEIFDAILLKKKTLLKV